MKCVYYAPVAEQLLYEVFSLQIANNLISLVPGSVQYSVIIIIHSLVSKMTLAYLERN